MRFGCANSCSHNLALPTQFVCRCLIFLEKVHRYNIPLSQVILTRNTMKTIDILKITSSVQCPLLLKEHSISDQPRHIALILLPLLTTRVTYSLAFRIVRGSRSMMLRCVNGKYLQHTLVPINRNADKCKCRNKVQMLVIARLRSNVHTVRTQRCINKHAAS